MRGVGPGRMKLTSASRMVLLLLCLMYFITYLDRVDVGTAAAGFSKDFKLNNTQIGLVFSAFAYPYLLFQIIGAGSVTASERAGRSSRAALSGRLPQSSPA